MRRHLIFICAFTVLLFYVEVVRTTPAPPYPPLPNPPAVRDDAEVVAETNISTALFAALEQLSRIVDITYCLGATGTGISPPFQCASRCGFLVVDHGGGGGDGNGREGRGGGEGGGRGEGGTGRVIVAFRGTYSIANTIVDLSTVPQEYVPYPGSGNTSRSDSNRQVECTNCMVHTGFWTSWQNTRPFVLPHLKAIRAKYPSYKLELVGHSLGGAVAALAGLEFDAAGWEPVVTTFGEPRVGNEALRDYIDDVFGLQGKGGVEGRYRRVTHIDDPVPLLPLREWGYAAHAGEIYISKPELQPARDDIRFCDGDEDGECIAGADADGSWLREAAAAGMDELDMDLDFGMDVSEEQITMLQKRWGIPIPARYKMWQLFFAHRDYFWRLGLCVPGGDPFDWGRDKYDFGDGGDGDGDGDQVQIDL
ncbi:Lipase A [Lachnellula occidentalis]|uniref:Lipase A n=1 Tax=Lachnellula occidentalis TaxID=215460 RepID=A0A8H8U6D6_9HELO|nr:Lipase A [Lachnellula occidentalis]